MTITSDDELRRKYVLKLLKRRKEIIQLLQKEELELRAEFGFYKEWKRS